MNCVILLFKIDFLIWNYTLWLNGNSKGHTQFIKLTDIKKFSYPSIVVNLYFYYYFFTTLFELSLAIFVAFIYVRSKL